LGSDAEPSPAGFGFCPCEERVAANNKITICNEDLVLI
jgi:hypothetical protein